jgi:hypothetical protein
MNNEKIALLVGDNPFHGISHLSQKRARDRLTEESSSTDQAVASELVNTALQTGAQGFMFSVSDTTLSIVKSLDQTKNTELYAIVPYAYEYVRLATKLGGMSGLAKKVFTEILLSSNIFKMAPQVFGIIRNDPVSLLKTYLIYEIDRINSVKPKNAQLKSVLLHEIITDMALALDLDWLFKAHIEFLLKRKIRPGFETRNFVCLVDKFEHWGIDFSKITITAPFNSVGFQMNPSKAECERALEKVTGCELIAMSILAAGYLNPVEAAPYIKTLPNVTHVVVGVSKKSHAQEGFRLFDQEINGISLEPEIPVAKPLVQTK